MIGVQREQDFRDDIEVVSSDGVSFQFNEVWTGTRRNQKSELIVNQIKSCHQPCLAWPVFSIHFQAVLHPFNPKSISCLHTLQG